MTATTTRVDLPGGVTCALPVGWDLLPLASGIAVQEPGSGTARVRFAVLTGLPPSHTLEDALESALGALVEPVLIDVTAADDTTELLYCHVDAGVPVITWQRQTYLEGGSVAAAVSVPTPRWGTERSTAAALLDAVEVAR